jgi:hypothetical protein
MTRDFFDPTPEDQTAVLVDTATLRKAEQLIESCENAYSLVVRSFYPACVWHHRSPETNPRGAGEVKCSADQVMNS